MIFFCWQLFGLFRYCGLKQLNEQLFLRSPTGCCRYSFWSEHWSSLVGNYLVDAGIVDWSSQTSNYLCIDQLVAKATPFHQVINLGFFSKQLVVSTVVFHWKTWRNNCQGKRYSFLVFCLPSPGSAFIVLCEVSNRGDSVAISYRREQYRTESEIPDGTISVPQQHKRKNEDWKGVQIVDTKQEWCRS